MNKLTTRQSEVLKLIQSRIKITGSPPTRAEIATLMGFSSPNAAEDHLRALARKGVLELIPGTSRGIRLRAKNANLASFNPAADYTITMPDNSLQHLNILAGDLLAVHKANNINGDIDNAKSTDTDESLNQLIIAKSNNNDFVVNTKNKIKNLIDLNHDFYIEGIIVGIIRVF